MKVKEKRIVRGYKIANSGYYKAMRRATKDKVSLATMIEVWVNCYGKGLPYFISAKNIKGEFVNQNTNV